MAEYERRFRREGLPLFIEDYSASEDIFTRAAPLLALVFFAELFGAIDFEFSLLENIGAAAGGIAILAGALALLNLARGRRPFAVPESVGRAELAGFVLLPAVLPVIFSEQVTSAVVTVFVNLVLLGLIYVGVGLALPSMLRWALGRLGTQLAATVTLLTRAIPLLLVFALVLFVNTEAWQAFSSMPGNFYAMVGGLFVGLGSVFLIARLPREVADLERDVGTGPPLRPRQRANVGLVMFVSQALQVLVVSMAVFGFFVAFGALAIGPEVRESWIGSTGNELMKVTLWGDTATVTTELLRVSGGIAAVSGLYYAIAVLTDATYREEFLEEITSEMKSTFKARAEYLTARGDA